MQSCPGSYPAKASPHSKVFLKTSAVLPLYDDIDLLNHRSKLQINAEQQWSVPTLLVR